jgi:hypothetical protein
MRGLRPITGPKRERPHSQVFSSKATETRDPRVTALYVTLLTFQLTGLQGHWGSLRCGIWSRPLSAWGSTSDLAPGALMSAPAGCGHACGIGASVWPCAVLLDRLIGFVALVVTTPMVGVSYVELLGRRCWLQHSRSLKNSLTASVS